MNGPNAPNVPNMAPRGGGTSIQTFVSFYRGRQTQVNAAWQQTVSAEERAQQALQFFTQYKLIKPEVPDMDAMRTSVNFEIKHFMSNQSKEDYLASIKRHFVQMHQGRQQRGQQPPIINSAQMGMVGQPGMSNPRPNPTQQLQQNFPNPQLQRPMQASPIPMVQNTSSMGMNVAMNGANMAGAQQRNTPQQTNQRPPQQPGPIPGLEDKSLNDFTLKYMQMMGPEFVAQTQREAARLTLEQRERIKQQTGLDPVVFICRNRLQQQMKSGQGQSIMQQMQQMQQMQRAGQQNAMANQASNMNQRQAGLMNGGQDFDMTQIANQQREALRVQDQGQTVVPASNNAVGAQMMGFPGQNPQAGQSPDAIAQRQTYARLQAQRQAQAQAVAQAAAQGQGTQQMLNRQHIGSLNVPPGTQQSPAMAMLTRPMVPPGPQGPSTPQQGPRVHVPQMTPQAQSHLDPQVAAQIFQAQQAQRVALMSQSQPLTQQDRLSMMPAQFADDLKQHLLQLPEPQFRNILQQHLANRKIGMVPNAIQTQMGQPNAQLNQAQALQLGMAPAQMGSGSNMNNLNRQSQMMPGQQMPNGPQMMAPNANVQRQIMQEQAEHLLRTNPRIVQAIDNHPVPPGALSAHQRQQIPSEVENWAQLKQWVSQNSGTDLDVNRLLRVQAMHFLQLRQQQNSQRAMNVQGVLPQNNPVNQAPQAQMAPGMPPVQGPRPGPQQQPGMPLGLHHVNPQEVALFRQRLEASHQQGVTDEQIRTHIIRMRQRQMVGNQMQQPVMAPQAAQLRAPAQQPPSQPVPMTKPMSKAGQPPKPAPQVPQNNLKQGTKRANEEANGGNSGGASTQNAAPQAPPMVQSRSQQGVSNLIPQQVASTTPQQHPKVREGLLKAQELSNKPQPGVQQLQTQRLQRSTEEIMARIRSPAGQQHFQQMIMEAEQRVPTRPPVHLSPEARARMQQAIHRARDMWGPKLDTAIPFFEIGWGDPKSAKDLYGFRVDLYRQFNPKDQTLFDQVTMPEEEFISRIGTVSSFVQRILQAARASQRSAQINAQQLQPHGPYPGKPAQLNAENLRLVQQQTTNQRQQNFNPTHAPTTGRPSYQLGAQSPSGTPTYLRESGIKPDDLRLPNKHKRQKLDPGASQIKPPTETASPRAVPGKPASPDVRRLQQPVEQKPAPTFKCTDSTCDFSFRGFETQAELDAHVKEAHATIEDPLQFSLDALADSLDIDPTTEQLRGQDQGSVVNSGAKAAPQPARLPANSAVPRVTAQAGTAKGSPSTNLLKTPQLGTKTGTPNTGSLTRATPNSTSKPLSRVPESIVAQHAEKPKEDLPHPLSSLLEDSNDDPFTRLDEGKPFTVLDLKEDDYSWMLRSSSPAIDTPESSSKDTPSTRQSDVSENDNLMIDLTVTDASVPDAWLAIQGGSTDVPLDVKLSADLQGMNFDWNVLDTDPRMCFYGEGEGAGAFFNAHLERWEEFGDGS